MEFFNESSYIGTAPVKTGTWRIMFGFSQKSKMKKGIPTFVIDIGTEGVKTQVFKKVENKTFFLAKSSEYFENYKTLESSYFGREVLIKTISKTLENLALKGLKFKKNFLVQLGLPANILKGRIIFQNLKRIKTNRLIDEKEERYLINKVKEEAKKNASLIFKQESGILLEDIEFIDFKILEIKIDGYEVPLLQKYSGQSLDFRIFATFLPKQYLKVVEDISRKLRFKNKKIIHEAEEIELLLNENSDELILDIGDDITQIFIIKNRKLEIINEFDVGGEIFSHTLFEKLGLTIMESKILKERYTEKDFSKESLERIKEFFVVPVQVWFKDLKLKLRSLLYRRLLPLNILIFGGGSKISEIEEILKEGNWEGVSLVGKPEVEVITPKKIINRKNLEFMGSEEVLNDPQNTPPLLIYYAGRATWNEKY